MLEKLDTGHGEYHKLNNWINGLLKVPFWKVWGIPIKKQDGSQKIREFFLNSYNKLDNAVCHGKPAKSRIMQILSKLRISNRNQKVILLVFKVQWVMVKQRL